MRRILVVDDEEIIVKMIAGQLEGQFDAEVYMANSAVKAMELLRKMKFHILITDIEMPSVSGLELLDFTKQNWPSCHVIVLTAYREFRYAYRVLQHDKIDYVLKVDGWEQLVAKVKKHWEQIEQEEALSEYYNRLDDAKSEMASYFKARILEKFFEYHRTVKQEELDVLHIPLSVERPVFLVVGNLQNNLSPENLDDIFSIPDYVEKNMELKNIRVLFYDKTGEMIWMFQLDHEDREEESALVYIRECFHELVDLVNVKQGNQLSLVMGNRFTSVKKLYQMYQEANLLLEQSQGEGCVRMLEGGTGKEHHTYPNGEELNYLLQLLKKRKDRELIDTIEKEMYFLRQIKDLRRVLPLPAVSALEILVQESKRLYDLPNVKDSECLKLLYSTEGEVSGAAWLDEVIHMLSQRLYASKENNEHQLNHMIQWVEKYIDENYMQDLSLTSLAEMVNYNPMYLSRLYSKQMGKTLVDTINSKRVEAARNLLKNSGIKIKDIATEVGFYSVKHFNQVFSKHFGMSASDYRKQWMEH